MVTMIRSFFRNIIESLKSLKRNGWMTIASVSAVTVTLVLVGLFLTVILNVSKLTKDIEEDVNVSVFVDIGTTQEEVTELQKELEKIPNVKEVSFSSKEEEYKKLIATMGKEMEVFEGDSNPLYDVFKVSTTAPEHTKPVQKKASTLKNVFKADYGGVSSDKLFKVAKAVRTWGLGASVLLLFVAVFLISNTIRITILSRKREIQIMRLVGAKNSFIRWPFFLEGAWIGMLGAVLPIFLMTFIYSRAYSYLNAQFISSGYSLVEPPHLTLMVNGLMLLIGVIIGSIGSIMSMRKFLKI